MDLRKLTVRRAQQALEHRFRKWITNPFLRAPARLWYGNDAGWRHNWIGKTDIKRLRRQLGSSAPVVQDERAVSLSRDGYVLLNPGYDERLLQTITDKVHGLMDDSDTSFPLAAGNVCTRLLGLLARVPEVHLLLCQDIQNLLLAFYGTWFRVWGVSCWRIKPVPNYDGREEVYSNFWHCDYAPTSIMKLFVNLSDVTPETGAFRLHSIASTKEIMRSGYWSRWWIGGPARRMVEEPSRVICVSGPVGSAVLCSTEACLHRASIPRAGTYRDIIEFKLEPSAEPLAADWWLHVASDPTEQRELARRRVVYDRD